MEPDTPKTVLITGASRGIGAAAAELFAAQGCSLILTCRRSIEQLNENARRLSSQYGVLCRAFQADMGCEAEAEALFSNISGLDVLINNAGISHIGLLAEMTADQWRQVMASNLDACFFACRAAIPLLLKKHRGKIINVSSVWGSCGASMEVAYSASKGGVNAFTKALARELAPSNIQVNAVSFGVIDTQMNAHFTEDEREALRQEIPAGRFGTPQEAARLLLMAAQAPDYLTGQIITLDGGWC